MDTCGVLRRFSPTRFSALVAPPPALHRSPAAVRTAAPSSRRAQPVRGGRDPASAALPLSTVAGDTRRRAYDALLLDAGGTLLQLARPVEETYASIGKKYGLKTTESEIKQGFRRAFAAQWPEKLRYQGDGRPFWRLVVAEATGCTGTDYFEEVYEHFANGDAWHLPLGAYDALCLLKDAQVKLAVVSNFDTRLRKLLKDLNVAHLSWYQASTAHIPIFHERTKHIKVDCHFIRDQVHTISLHHIPTDAQNRFA